MRCAWLLLPCVVGACSARRPASNDAVVRNLIAYVAPMAGVRSTLTGTISLTSTDGEVYSVTVDLRGGRGIARLAWAIRPRQCGGAVAFELISPNEYPLIAVQPDGEAHVRLTLRVALPDEPLRIDVGLPGMRPEAVVSCGVLAER